MSSTTCATTLKYRAQRDSADRRTMMYMRALIAAVVLGTAMCTSAADRPDEAPPRESADKESAEQPATKKRGDAKGRDLSSCRRDAKGLHGPERARFMTECLRNRE
jgi:hypothetical protein